MAKLGANLPVCLRPLHQMIYEKINYIDSTQQMRKRISRYEIKNRVLLRYKMGKVFRGMESSLII